VGSQTTSYQYDVLGNLIGAILPNGATITYLIDAKNRRVGKQMSGVLQAGFLYDGNQVVAQLNGSNQIVSQFIYATGATSPDYMVSGGVTYRIFSDQVGSPRLVVNSSTGAITEQINYDEFGNVISDTNPGFQPFGFAGGLYDQDTKLVRFGARDYEPSVGRWTAKDPIRFASGDSNLYGYVLDDPLNRIDLSGLCDSTLTSNNTPYVVSDGHNRQYLIYPHNGPGLRKLRLKPDVCLQCDAPYTPPDPVTLKDIWDVLSGKGVSLW
jgi:RHS repeat-associated protein